MNRKILFTDLAAAYEEQFSVPESQRLTCYFGDYGQHFLLPGVTDEQLQAVCQKALSAMGLTEEELDRDEELLHQQEPPQADTEEEQAGGDFEEGFAPYDGDEEVEETMGMSM